MNIENFNSELYEKCVAASELLFNDLLTEVIEKEQLSSETIEIIKEDNAKRLYNLVDDFSCILRIDVNQRIQNHFRPEPLFLTEYSYYFPTIF